MVRDLEQVETGQVIGQERRIDRLLDVARQQEPVVAHRPEQHDRDVVDPRPAVRRHDRHLASDGPQDTKVDVVDREPVAGGEPEADR